MFGLSTQPKSIGGVLKCSWRLYKATFLKLLVVSLIYAVIFILPNLFWQIRPNQPLPPNYVWMTLIIDLIIFWLFTLMLYRSNQVMSSSKQGYGKALKITTSKYIFYLAANILFLIMAVVGTALFVLPGIFLVILLVFYLPFMVIENKKVFESFKFSAKIVWGNWWRTFLIFLISAVVSILVFIVLELVFNIPLTAIFKFDASRLNYMAQIIMVLFLVIILPWNIAVMLSQFHDLKLRHKFKSNSVEK